MSSRSTLSWILRGASPSANYYAAFCALITTVLTAGFIWFKQKSRLRPSLPPGPKPVFALGNIRDITSSKEVWLPATKWAKEFGAFSVSCLSKNDVTLINSFRQRGVPAYFGTRSCLLEHARGRL